LPVQKVLVDYDKLPMRCKACHSWKHRVRDCKEIQKKSLRGGRRPLQTFHQHQQEKGKNIVLDEDGFQQVRNRKNTRRNIFDLVNDEMRGSAYALIEEDRAARYRSRQRADGHALERPGEWRHEGQTENLDMGEGSDVEGYKDLGPARENQNNEKGNGNTTQPIEKTNESNGPTEMEVDRNIQKEGGVMASISAVKGPGLNGSAGEEGVGTSPNGGRGDPTSTMLWSPRKHAGQKRPLDTEVVVSDNETSDDEDEMSEGNQEGEATDEGEQPRPVGEPEHQVNGDRIWLNEETETLAASEGDRRGKATCTAVKRQSAKVAAVSARDDRIQEEGERFMGMKIKGVVPQPNGSPVEEVESPRAEQAREEGEPNSETSGEGQTDANKEEEQPEAAEGGEEWSEREEERRELEQVGRRGFPTRQQRARKEKGHNLASWPSQAQGGRQTLPTASLHSKMQG
jgi:hypothetical protein